ncbi:MAG: hypothetical protein GF364_17130, partial [Candidatus Lokiarchaeota archaeon]|nr:hypothetical protein [Candidatus Lokiarchaeota archaeon]
MSEEASELLREISRVGIAKTPNGVSANALKEKAMQLWNLKSEELRGNASIEEIFNDISSADPTADKEFVFKRCYDLLYLMRWKAWSPMRIGVLAEIKALGQLLKHR